MGIIRVGFLQSVATWYQRATGGTPTTNLSTLSTYSVQVQKHRAVKRSIEAMAYYATQGIRAFSRRDTTQTQGSGTTGTSGDVKVVRGSLAIQLKLVESAVDFSELVLIVVEPPLLGEDRNRIPRRTG